MPEWINKMTCAKCKKKGHLAFNCPPKYNNKVRKISNKTNKNISQDSEQRNHENRSIEQAANLNEFAGHTYQDCIHETNRFHYISRNKNNYRKWNPSKGFLYHKLRIQKLC